MLTIPGRKKRAQLQLSLRNPRKRKFKVRAKKGGMRERDLRIVGIIAIPCFKMRGKIIGGLDTGGRDTVELKERHCTLFWLPCLTYDWMWNVTDVGPALYLYWRLIDTGNNQRLYWIVHMTWNLCGEYSVLYLMMCLFLLYMQSSPMGGHGLPALQGLHENSQTPCSTLFSITVVVLC